MEKNCSVEGHSPVPDLDLEIWSGGGGGGGGHTDPVIRGGGGSPNYFFDPSGLTLV